MYQMTYIHHLIRFAFNFKNVSDITYTFYTHSIFFTILRHTDGSVRFWDASAGSLQVLYKLKTAKVFEKAKSKSLEGSDEDQFSVQLLSFCPESRKLAVAGISSYVVLFKFRKLESTFETTVMYHSHANTIIKQTPVYNHIRVRMLFMP